MINFSDPFSIKELKDIYKESPAKALLAFTQKCNENLLKEVIIIEDKANDWIAENLFIMERHNMVFPFFQWRFDTDDRRIMEKTLADKINHLAKTSKEDLETLKSSLLLISSMKILPGSLTGGS
jgi:hypothetical protein